MIDLYKRECLDFMESEEFKAIEILQDLRDDSTVRFLDETLYEAIKELRSRYEPRCKTNGTRALSREFNVSQAQISFIVNNRERVKHEHI